jgi:hypothetical protein
MAWDAGAGKLSCASCGATKTVAGAVAIVEHELDEGLAKPRGKIGAGARQVRCRECGAVVEFADRVTATRCSFCDSPSVLEEDAREDHLKPESLIPFAVGREAAVAAFKGWLGKLWFRPADLSLRANVSELRGVYVPYWTFSTAVTSYWSADAGYHYTVTETVDDGKGGQVTRDVTRTRWEPASGVRHDRWDDYLVCASAGLPEKHARAAAGFDVHGLVAYAPAYLAGFAAESYAVELRDAWTRGQGEIGAAQEGRCRADVPGDTCRDLRATHQYEATTFKHVLLPMWIAAFRYGDQVHRFLVNGQTGKVSGAAPLSWTKILLVVAATVALIVAAVLLLRR